MGRALSTWTAGRRLLLITTAGHREGRGHLARALALAEAAEEMAVPVRLAVLRGTPSQIELARAAAAGAVVSGGRPTLGSADPGERTVVDLPDPTEMDPEMLAAATVFDDSGALQGRAAAVVQPSLPTWDGTGRAEADLVMAGYGFAPLSRAIRAAAIRPRAAAGGRPCVLVCFGGSDPHDIAWRLWPAVTRGASWDAEIVLGPDYRGRLGGPLDGGPGRAGDPAGDPGPGPTTRVVRDPPDLAGRLAAADLAVLGAGTMKLEAAALGVPAVLVGAAEDQLAVGPPFAATGAADWAGDGRTLDPSALRAAVEALLADPARRAMMSRSGRAIVGQDGARRIIEATLARLAPREAAG